MSSGNDSDAYSERETQFVPRSDDDDTLWEVQEITAERGRNYKVKWEGINPATRKPWAQSWVPKHDCTDKLVAEWKAKKRRLQLNKTRRGGRRGTTSRTSSTLQRAGSSMTSGRKTRTTPSEATSSRLDSIEQQLPTLPKKSTTKRKRKQRSESESPVPSATSDGALQDDDAPRPHKKQKVASEKPLVSPVMSEDEELPITPEEARAKGPLQIKVSNRKRNSVSRDREDDPPPKAKAKAKSLQRLEASSKEANSGAFKTREGSGVSRLKKKTEVVLRRRERVTNEDTTSRDEEYGSPAHKKMSTLERRSPSEQSDSPPGIEPTAPPIKIGPPRGVKRRKKSSDSGTSSKHEASRVKSRGNGFADGQTCAEEPERHPRNEASSSSGGPLLTRQDTINSHTSATPSNHISIPQVPSSMRPRSPELSPGARARLELFDRMMADTLQPDAAASNNVPQDVPEDVFFNYIDDHDGFGTLNPPHSSSLPPSTSKPKPELAKPASPNGLIVPESESSGNSQSQPGPLLMPPPPLPQAHDKSPRKPVDLPAIAVISASATSSSTPSPQDLLPPMRVPSSANRPSKGRVLKPVPQISPNTFRSTIKERPGATDSEAPPSSIESFETPKRLDKGKQRAIEDVDELESSLPETESARRKGIIQNKPTDSELRRKGKELFEEALQRREIARKKNKAKQLKAVGDIVNGSNCSPFERRVLSPVSEAEDTLPVGWGDTVDVSGGANSTTLDTPEYSETRPLSEEERERLRIALRQEEEESTQEAMGAYLPLPLKSADVIDDRNAQMSPPKSQKDILCDGSMGDVDHLERPSDIQLASIIVQASQEPQHEDMDVEPSLPNQPTSSPARPILENLTDSPKRRLGEALSLLNVKSEEIQRLERELADERKNLQGLKTEVVEVQRSLETTGSALAALEAGRVQWSQEQSKWEGDRATWETQSKEWHEEKTSLLARVAELSDTALRTEEMSTKLSELETERATWAKEREGMLNDVARRLEAPSVGVQASTENDEDRAKWESERASWAEERVKWEFERTELKERQETLSHSVEELAARVASATAAKVSAEKDKEFFREQYAQASGFVGSVREENLELEKRVKIAEGQAQEGVAAIKAMFEGRIKALQDDIDRWKGLTELLQEKDRRTNDEVRLRAAQALDLAELCDRLRLENKSLEGDFQKLSQTQQRCSRQRHKLYFEIFVLKKERASLKSKLSQLVKIVGGSTQESSRSALAMATHKDPDDIDPNDMVILPDSPPEPSYPSSDETGLFPCMWRPQWRDQCQQVFDTKEDLERHLQQHFLDLSTEQ